MGARPQVVCGINWCVTCAGRLLVSIGALVSIGDLLAVVRTRRSTGRGHPHPQNSRAPKAAQMPSAKVKDFRIICFSMVIHMMEKIHDAYSKVCLLGRFHLVSLDI